MYTFIVCGLAPNIVIHVFDQRQEQCNWIFQKVQTRIAGFVDLLSCRRAPSAERRAPSAERRAPRAERRGPRAERRAPSAERRAPSAERRAPSAQRPAPSGIEVPASFYLKRVRKVAPLYNRIKSSKKINILLA